MDKLRVTGFCLMLIAFTFLGAVPPGWGEQKPADKTSASEVRQKMTEAINAIKSYTSDQREEAMKKARSSLNDLDASIERIEKQAREKWSQMNQTARDKASTTLPELRKRRNELAEQYGALKQSSKEAWGHVRDGFVKSYRSLSEAFDKAEKALR